MTGMKADVIMVVVGGIRPHFIKIAALKRIIEKFNSISEKQIELVSINSGQHYSEELAGSIIHELGLKFDFTINHEERSSIRILGNTIVGVYEILRGMVPKPSWVIILGDANASLAGAIAASKAEVPIIHIEAGSAVSSEITPEALNGRVIEQLTAAYFCASHMAEERLKNIGINKQIYLTGDITRDFVIMYSERIAPSYRGYQPGDYVLVTLHHVENLQSRNNLDNLISVLSQYPKKILFITHPNTRDKLVNWGLISSQNIEFIPALPYSEMLSAIKGCAFIITDSGGLQREAYYLNKRCLILLDIEFWPNLTQSGFHQLIRRDKESIINGITWIENELTKKFTEKIEDMGNDDLVIKALSHLIS